MGKRQGGGTQSFHAACQRELAATKEELRRSQEHLALFAGQVSHDLRTPLTAILAQAEMLAAEPAVKGDEDLGWMVEAIARASRRLNTMIEQMLDYARGGGEVALGVTDLGRVVEAVIRDLTPAIAEADAQVTVHALPTLAADPRQMHAVFLNLLSNAIMFSRPDVLPRVHVGAERVGERWRISVSDNGIGVAPERREAMFALFARVDKRIEGAGIGLAVAKRVVEAHEGRIGMEDSPGGGTTVWFELPA
ncbi:MAG TPA: HAMP domain-containing sensor histidine kinase [Nocardioidaceae bacterium]|nr:HAMP domain-containing sensor histidine kinase [Nocardioidaceae bacterium]